MNNNEAVQFNRIHHQLSPNRLEYQDGGEGWTDLMQKLHFNRGHELAPIDTNDFETTPVIQSIYIQDDGIIQAVSDYRHGGIPDGH